MRHFFLVIALSLHVGCALTPQNGSHNLLPQKNNSTVRAARCTPCGQDVNYRKPISNHLDPDYRGNGADNLGYDWSAMAWGGLAYPQRPKMYMGGSRGRDGKMMPGNWGRNPGNPRVVCDTCRTYWDDGRSSSREHGRMFNMDPYYNQPGQWNGDRMRGAQDYETRVMSPTVGVLVKPGSRIAYIPSRSGEMYWDGISGGGTRWDGFSNGISWIGNGAPSGSNWDRMDSNPRDEKTAYGSGSHRPEGDYQHGSNGFGLWNDGKGTSWSDDRGRGYYFSNGVPNEIDPQWRDRGYASNWHYGNTNQNGWNGSNMKWNYGKPWPDSDRAANQFYFNGPQDRTYGPSDGNRFQYGNQYPNYQPTAGYPNNFRPQPSWPNDGGYRPNDRFPSTFQGGSQNGDDTRPWDYTSRDRLGYRRPGFRPQWARPGGSGKFPDPQRGYDKFSPADKNDYEKPWAGPSGYGPKPSPGGGFPYGGNRYPEETGSNPSFPKGGGHLFYPNEGNRQPSYPQPSGGALPAYQGGYPSSGNQVGTYPGDGGRPSGEYPRPSVIYTGGKPSGGSYPSGSTSGGYPSTGGSSGGYPDSSGGYPVKGNRPGGYPGGGGVPAGYSPGGGSGSYPSSSGSYPGGGSGSYPSGGSGGYPVGSSGTHSSEGSGSYPSSGSGSYPGSGSGSYPGSGSGSYPGSGSGSYPGGGSGTYPSGGSGSYPVGSSGGYPGGSSGSYPGGSSGSYPGGSSGSYPGGSSGSYPGGGSGSYPSGGFPSRPGYPSGGSGTYPSGGFPSRPSYPVEGGLYPIGNGRPGSYPAETGGKPPGYPEAGSKPSGYPYGSNRPEEYPSGGRPGYPGAGGYPQGGKNSPKGYYTGFITELSPDNSQVQYGGKNPNYFGGSYPGDKNSFSDKDRDKYFYGIDSNRYQPNRKDTYPAYPGGVGGGGGGSYPVRDKDGYDRNRDKYYYGLGDGKGQYPGGFPSNHRYPGAGGGSDFDRNQGSTNDKNAWNYGQNDHKEGIYRRSGGSYPPYRGGQYYTSSYLASMSTTAGSTEPKTQSETKADEVTQPTSDSS